MRQYKNVKGRIDFLNIVIAFFIIFSFNSYSIAQDNVPDFPYDPEEKATETKMCAKVCLRRRDACIRREASNPERDQICQSQMIICVNKCR
tara:strand:- start:140 stop:412 length:273 start_codon:yes stop_codon:yes gene_type:complete